jgi:hypothetical protein
MKSKYLEIHLNKPLLRPLARFLLEGLQEGIMMNCLSV